MLLLFLLSVCFIYKNTTYFICVIYIYIYILIVKGQKQGVEEVLAKYAPNSFLIPSSNHPDIMAGQGTVTMELLEQVGDLWVISC